MSWTIDDSAYQSAQHSQVKVTQGVRRDYKFNAMWVDKQDTNTVWRFKILKGQGIWFGVGTEDTFGKCYGAKGLFYGGPGNLSNGMALVMCSWGPELVQGDTIDMKVQNISGDLTVEFGRNGFYLGTAFDIKGWNFGGQVIRPIVSLRNKGDCVTISKIEASEFPTAVQVPDDDDITGVWKSDTDPSYTLCLYKVDQRTCAVSASVRNSIFGTVKHDGRKWQSQGGTGHTNAGVWDPKLVNLERTVSKMLQSIDGIVRDGTGLIVNFGGTTNKFVRAPKPAGATKEDMTWMLEDMNRMLGRDTSGRKEKSSCGQRTSYISCCPTF